MALFPEPMVGVDLRFGRRRQQDWWFPFSLCCATTHHYDGKLGVAVAAYVLHQSRSTLRDWVVFERSSEEVKPDGKQ